MRPQILKVYRLVVDADKPLRGGVLGADVTAGMSAPFYLGSSRPDPKQFVVGTHYCALGLYPRETWRRTEGGYIPSLVSLLAGGVPRWKGHEAHDCWHGEFMPAINGGQFTLLVGEFPLDAVVIHSNKDGQVFLTAAQVESMRPLTPEAVAGLYSAGMVRQRRLDCLYQRFVGRSRP
jgi:hypothetical protein